jgi:hypothetical protein
MSIGSVSSFWQQDQNFWSQAKAQSQQETASNSLIEAMGTIQTDKVSGLDSIVNQEALSRTNTALTAALQSALQQSTGSSTSSSSGSSSSSSTSTSSSTAGSPGSPAVGTGTVPLSISTSLSSLGIPPNSAFTVSDGTYATTYTSGANDTVANLINAFNADTPGTAQVTASLNSSGNLVITGNSVSDSLSVTGTFMSNIGFGNNNNSFQPTAPTPASSSTSSSSATPSSSSTSSAASSSSGTSSSSSSSTPLYNSSYLLQTSSSAETLLAASGLTGSLLDIVS